MMTYTVQYTDSAVEDLDKIYSFYRYDLGMSAFSEVFFESLVEGMEDLKTDPEKCKRCPVQEWERRDLRLMPISGGEVFYIPNSTNQSIAVIRILFPRIFSVE